MGVVEAHFFVEEVGLSAGLVAGDFDEGTVILTGEQEGLVDELLADASTVLGLGDDEFEDFGYGMGVMELVLNAEGDEADESVVLFGDKDVFESVGEIAGEGLGEIGFVKGVVLKFTDEGVDLV